MRIAFCTAESLPFVKTGGLADVSFALTQGLANQGHEVILFMPKYSKIKYEVPTTHELEFFVGCDYIGIDTCMVGQVKYVFIDNEYYFDRTNGNSNYYGHGDDAKRFILFSRAILDYFGHSNWFPELVHVNDWHTAMLPYILNSEHRADNRYANIRTYLTIHNMEFQGWARKEDCYVKFDYSIIKNNSVNFLQAGILNSTKITTVSPTYRNATLTPIASYGLDDVLNARINDYVGILNGIDYEYFNPLTDEDIYFPIKSSKILKDKLQNKIAFKKEYGFTDLERPLYCVITRLTSQKGVDLLLAIIEEMLDENLDLFVLGSGDYYFEEQLNNVAARRENLKTYIGYNEELAHKLYASSDFLLMPSRFEPCGLSQMIAMRYACIPIVHDVDGLHDSVQSYNEFDNTGNGLKFDNFDAFVLLNTIKYAQYLYYNFNHIDFLRENAYNTDFSTEVQTNHYLDLYKQY